MQKTLGKIYNNIKFNWILYGTTLKNFILIKEIYCLVLIPQKEYHLNINFTIQIPESFLRDCETLDQLIETHQLISYNVKLISKF